MREDIGEFKMTRNEWICRGCEDGPEDILHEGEFRMNKVDKDPERTKLYRPDSIAHPIHARRVCDRCGKTKICYKRSSVLKVPEKALEPVEALKEALEVAKTVPVANVVSDTSGGEVELPKPPEAEPEPSEKEKLIAEFKAKIEALEAE